MSSIPFHRRIGVRIFAALLGVAAFSVAVTSTSHYLFAGAVMRSSVAQRNLQIARRAAGEIQLYMEDSMRSVGAVGHILGPIRDEWMRDIILENVTVLLEKFGAMHLVDEQGNIIASSDLDNAIVELPDGIIDSIRDLDAPWLSDVELSSENLPMITIAEPVTIHNGVRCALVAVLHLRDIWRLVDDISFGESGIAYLVSSDRVLIAHPDKTRVLTPSDIPYLPTREQDWSETMFTGKEESGPAMLVATAHIQTVGWHLVIEQRLSEVYMPVYTTMLTLLVIAVLVLVTATLASFMLARQYSIPLNRLLDGTNRIRRGDLDYRIPIESVDEIGRLSRSFNTMVEDLQKRSVELAQSEEKYRLLTENVNDIIFVADPRGRIIHINRRATELIGPEASFLVGQTFSDLLPKLDSHGGRSKTFEVAFDSKTGGALTLEFRMVMTEDPKHGILYYGVARDVSERKEAERRLQEYQEQLRSLASQLSLAEARERKKIATEIHDRICQTLALARIKLGTLGGDITSIEGSTTLTETTRLIEAIITDTRSLIFSVSSPLLYEFGLAAALERLVEQFTEEHGLSFFFDGDGEQCDLETDVSVLLFDSVRELMVNVVKHSQARNCRVSMNASEEEISLTVADDGAGMNGASASRHASSAGGFGLFSIRERLDHIGGEMRLTSEPGVGTTITLAVPRRVG